MRRTTAPKKMTANEKLVIAIFVIVLCVASGVICIVYSQTPAAFLGCFVVMFIGCEAAISDYVKTRREEKVLKACA